MKLTNEEIAKVFAMYVPCKILNGVDGDLTQRDLRYKNIDTYTYTMVGQPKLLLYPLINITDEHAIEVGKIWGYLVDKTNPLIMEKCHRIANDYSKIVMNATIAIEINEYLKSKGYAVKLWFGIDHWANGKTAIDLKIAIDKSTLKTQEPIK